MTDELDEHTVRVRRPAALPSWALPAADAPAADAPDDSTLVVSRARAAEHPARPLLLREQVDPPAVPGHSDVVRRDPPPSLPPRSDTAHPTQHALPPRRQGRVASGEQPPPDGAEIEAALRRTARRRALAVLGVAVAIAAASAVLLVVLLTIS